MWIMLNTGFICYFCDMSNTDSGEVVSGDPSSLNIPDQFV